MNDSSQQRQKTSWFNRVIVARIAATVVCGAAIFAFVQFWMPLQREMKVAKRVEELGGQVNWTYSDRMWVLLSIQDGQAFSNHVTAVHLNSTKEPVPADLLEELEALPGLQILSLKGATITHAGMKHISRLKFLSQLYFDGIQISDAELDSALQLLKSHTSVRVLGLERTELSDAGLEQLSELTGLHQLYLDGTRISDAGLEHLSRLPALNTLLLNKTNIGDEGLKHLHQMVTIAYLSLDRTKVTDSGLQYLTGLGNLGFLSLEGVSITDIGLTHLKGLTKLEEVRLSDTETTEESRMTLRQSLVKCRISPNP